MLRHILIDDPSCTAAWLWMSGLVTDMRQQRECLEQALAFNPDCAPASEGLKLLRLRAVIARIPATPSARIPYTPRKLGEYLITQGLIEEAQLEEALANNARAITKTASGPCWAIF